MAFSPLLLNKRAAILDKRLNAIFLVMLLFVFILSIHNFSASDGGTVKLYNKPQLTLSFSQDSIENGLNYNREADPLWALHTEDWSEQSLPKHRFPPYTKFYERFSASFLTTKDCTGGVRFEACVDLFESGNHKSPFDIEAALQNQFMTMGQNATLPGPDPRPLTSDELIVDTYLNLFAQAQSLKVSYTYALGTPPSNFFGIKSNIHPFGSNRDTRTVLLGSDGLPKQTFQPGDAIIIRLPKLLQLAQGTVLPSEALIPKTRSYGTSMGSAEMFPSWVWDTGCLLNMVINCFSSDRDIRGTLGVRAVKGHDEAVWKLDASVDEPICLLDVRREDSNSFHWVVKVQQPGITVRKRITNLRVIGQVGHSYFRAMNANAFLLFITSFLVLLALPQKIISFIILNCLGRLSAIYRNIMVQNVDIRECCAKAVLQLVSQSVCFVELADGLGPDGQDYGGISRSRMLERVQAVARHRSDVFNKDQVETLSDFTFGMATCPPVQQTWEYLILLKRILAGKKGARSAVQDGSRSSVQDQSPSIDIDSFCRATGSPNLGFDIIVQLFDRDRRLGIGERIFMPSNLWSRTYGSQPPPLPSSEEESGAESMKAQISLKQARIPLEQKKLTVESLLISHELSQAGDTMHTASGQTPRLRGMLQSMGTMNEQLAIMRANLEELKVELRKERELRSISESALRQELSRALQANADEFDIKMARIGNADFDHKDLLSQMRMELNTAGPDSCSKKDLVNLREDLEALRRDLSSHSAQTKQQTIVEARKAVHELVTLHGHSHQQSATSEKLMPSEPADKGRPEKLMVSEPIGKEGCQRVDAEPKLDHCSVYEPDTYGKSIEAAQAEAKHKVVPAPATVNQTETHQDLDASRARNSLSVARSQDARSCMHGWTPSRGDNECVDSWLSLPVSTWTKRVPSNVVGQ